jgi:hypothetical protein
MVKGIFHTGYPLRGGPEANRSDRFQKLVKLVSLRKPAEDKI